MNQGPGLWERFTKRRHLFVHPIQYRFLVADLLYLFVIVMSLAIPVFVPLMQALDDPSLSYQARGMVADQFLGLHSWFWLWALGALLLLILHGIHSVLMMHRIAGPLYRLQKVLGAVGGGELSARATLRKHDYLHQEAEALNRMLAHLQAMVRDLEVRFVQVTGAYDRVKARLAIGSNPELAETIRVLEVELAHLKAGLDAFSTRMR